MERSTDMTISVDSFIYESLVKGNIIKTIGNDEYQTIAPAKLILQKEKMRCVYFDHTEPDAMIKLLCDTTSSAPSGIDLMPDVNISQKSFDESAYSLGQQAGALKVRNFLFTTNNYAATLFVNDLIRTSKNVNTMEHVVKKLKRVFVFNHLTPPGALRIQPENVFPHSLLSVLHSA